MPQTARHALWQQLKDDHADVWVIEDVCKGVHQITEGEGASEPDDVIALAVAGAEAMAGVLAGLDSNWALYTPAQVACVASALCAQITAAGEALEKLDAHLDMMAERGDIAMPDPELAYQGESCDAGRLGRAQIALGSAGYAASTAVPADMEEDLRVLAAVRHTAPQPTSAHEAIAAVGRLLGDGAKLINADHCGGVSQSAHSDREHCGCRIELTARDGTAWAFYREDGEWALVRTADGSNGEIAASDPHADPRHLTALLQQAVGHST